MVPATPREIAQEAAQALRDGRHADGMVMMDALQPHYHDTRMPLVLRAIADDRFVDAADLLDLSVASMK